MIIDHLSHYGLKQVAPNRYLCRCPSHEDKSPSMTVTIEPDGKTLVHCFAGCSPEDIVSSLGLTMSNLFPDEITDEYRQKKQIQFQRAQFMSDYRLIQLGENWLKRGKQFSIHDKRVFKSAIDRVNQYKFNAHEVYEKLIREDATNAALNRAYYNWTHKTLEEKYGVTL